MIMFRGGVSIETKYKCALCGHTDVFHGSGPSFASAGFCQVNVFVAVQEHEDGKNVHIAHLFACDSCERTIAKRIVAALEENGGEGQ